MSVGIPVPSRCDGATPSTSSTHLRAPRRHLGHGPGELDLSRTFVHLGTRRHSLPDFAWSAEHVRPTGTVRRRRREGRLVCVIAAGATWDAWERHPAGDELVVLLSGRVDLVQEIDGAEHVVELRPGEAMINPPTSGTRPGSTSRGWPSSSLPAKARSTARSPDRRVSEPAPGRAGPAAGSRRRRATATPQGPRSSMSSSKPSPSASTMTSHWASVATSTDSRSARPSAVSAPSATRPRADQAALGLVELAVGPGPRADVGAHRAGPSRAP